MFPRKFFSEDHEIFRDATRRFIENEIVPNHAEWEQQGIVSRELWNAAGENGLLAVQCQRNMVAPGAIFYIALSSCLLYTSPSPRDLSTSRMPSSA